MKTGDIFHKMRPIQRLRHVMTRRYHMQEVYSSPDEVIADLSILFAELDSISASRDQIALDYRRLHKGRDEITNGITDVFRRFQFLYKDIPDLPILYESCLPNADGQRTPTDDNQTQVNRPISVPLTVGVGQVLPEKE